MCAYHRALLEYTVQRRTVLTTFPIIPQAIIISQMLPTGGEVPGVISLISIH